jgi:hypothetical protein
MFLPWSEHQSSHPHKATGKVIILFSFKFMGFMENSEIKVIFQVVLDVAN